MALVDHRDIVDWEQFQELIAEAVFKGYSRGAKDMREETLSFESIDEVVEDMNATLREHYYE